MTAIPKPVRERNEDYLEFIRSEPCCLHERFRHFCYGPLAAKRSQAHHVVMKGHKALASKPSDCRSVPVCQVAHDYCEAHPNEVRDYLELEIARLNREYDLLHPKERKKRKKPQNILTIVHCAACGKDHPMYYVEIIGMSATEPENPSIVFTCKSKNQRVLVEI